MTTCSPCRAGDVATTVAPIALSPFALSRTRPRRLPTVALPCACAGWSSTNEAPVMASVPRAVAMRTLESLFLIMVVAPQGLEALLDGSSLCHGDGDRLISRLRVIRAEDVLELG